MAASAAFVLRASKHVSMRNISTPPRINASACSRYASYIWSNECVLNEGSPALGDNESDLDVGPMLPATHTFRVSPISAAMAAASSAASRAMRAPSYAILAASEDAPYSSCDMALALKVLVSMMSAPAAIYSLWIFLIASGCVRLRRSELLSSSATPCFWIMVPIAPSSIYILSLNEIIKFSTLLFNVTLLLNP